MTSDYKKYSLENLENWLHDAMSVSEASPQEIYNVIISVVKDNYYTYKHQTSQAYELLALLNGNGKDHIKYDGCDSFLEHTKSWNSFFEENSQYTEEELNAMCDKAASDEEKERCREYNLREAEYYDKRAELDATYDNMIASGYIMTDDGFWIPPQKEDKVVKWQLPVEVDGASGEYYVNFPDDLLDAANLKEGDSVQWINRNDGSFELRKVNGTK